MYAVIQSGGKQYRVSEGDTLKLEKLAVEAGETIELDRVLMLGQGDNVKVGAPYVEGSKVQATVLGHGRGKKIQILKFRRRQNSMNRMGHRQDYTEIKVTGIA